MRNAWILPHGQDSKLWVRLDPKSYREGSSPIVEAGPVLMPARSVHCFDSERDRLIFAHKGALEVLRDFSGERKAARVKIPTSPRIHAVTVIDDVIFTGADAGRGMLGWVDLRDDLRWQGIGLPRDVTAPGKGIDGFALHGSVLVAIDDIVLPRNLILLDVANPRAPRVIESRRFPSHSSYERITSVSSNTDTVAILSSTANHGATASHIGFMDLATLEEWATLSVQGLHSMRRWAERSYDFHALALFGDLLMIAAGADGIGLLRVPPRPTDLATRARSPHEWSAHAPRIPIETVRFVPVPAGPVVDVVPVDETRAFAVMTVRGSGLFAKDRVETRLVSWA